MRFSDELLMKAAKPGRYTGGEINAVTKDPSSVSTRFAFCFPDAYDIGMSHLGLQLIYFFLNRRPDVYCERAFMPWPDMLALMNGHPLYALETGDELLAFDFLGFTLQYEMSYTNVLAMLDLAGIPLRAAERSDSHPLVCGGGPCACNPEPLADFFDFFYIGDAEAALDEIMERYREYKTSGGARRDFLVKITDVPGVYVPAFYSAVYGESGRLASFKPNRPEAPEKVKKALSPILDDSFFPDKLLTPLIETVHDRASLEVFRGCIRGCRFCQAGFIYRPVREHSLDYLLAKAENLISSTGHEEISLLSLAACDYTAFEPLVDGLLDRFAQQKVNISLPSLRVDAASLSVLQKTQQVRKSSLTFAPEAGSQRMRDIINKNLTEQDILDGCFRAFEAGFDKVKLYFMTGLPYEAEEDLDGIARLCERIAEQYYRLPLERRRRPVSLSVSASCFVPKPFTPFQWAAQDGAAVFTQKQQSVKKQIRKKQISYRYHDARTAVAEGALARGGRPLGRVIERAYRSGCVFDGWTEYFDYEKWQAAFKAENIDIEALTGRERPPEEIFPWDFIDMGVTKEFLRAEYERARSAGGTPNCREACAGCGINIFSKGVCAHG